MKRKRVPTRNPTLAFVATLAAPPPTLNAVSALAVPEVLFGFFCPRLRGG
jgi:hypothetical protein